MGQGRRRVRRVVGDGHGGFHACCVGVVDRADGADGVGRSCFWTRKTGSY